MWNHLDLKCPSDDLSEYPPQDQYLIEDLRELVTVLTTAADSLTTENPLWCEMQVLRNIQIKYKRILRCDKFLVHLHRIGHCLKKMVLLNLSRAYLDLAQRFLFQLQSSMYTTLNLPSRQQLEYMLVRTLSAAKLISEGIKYSREAFCFLIQKLKVGHLILDLVMATSVTARLNILLRATLVELCSTYKQVLSWRYKVKAGAHVWPKKLDLPQDLGDWVKTSESNCLDPIPMSEADVNMLTNLLKPSNKDKSKDTDKSKDKNNSKDKDSDSESVIVVEEVTKTRIISGLQNGSRKNDTDYGEIIPRKKLKTHHLATEHMSMLKKVVRMQSLKELENSWINFQDTSSDHFPKTLTDKKRRVINKFFSQIKSSVSAKKFNRTVKVDSQFFFKAVLLFCKNIGYTSDEVEMCIKHMNSTKQRDDTKQMDNTEETDTTKEPNVKILGPVKTFKELKKLYRNLRDVLKFSDETEKQLRLRKFFKRRTADIELLKQNGEKKIARKLIFCTSKVLLTLCQQ